MNLKKINIVLLILSFSILLFLITWTVIYNVIFPVPDMLDLITDDAVAYLDVYDLHKVLSSFLRSEFMRRVVQSPLWSNFQTTELWNEINTELIEFKQFGIDQGLIFRLIGTHSVIAFYLDPDKVKVNYTLISELDVFTRFTLSLGQIKKFIPPEYTVIKLKYKGRTITTIKSAQENYSYTFVGRLGILGNDEILVQNILDFYKNKKNELSKKIEFVQISHSLPLSNTSFYLNTSKLVDSSKMLEKYGFSYRNIPVISRSKMILGAVSSGAGKTSLNVSILHRQGDKISKIKDILPFPKDCLALTIHRSYDPNGLFRWLARNVSPTFSIIGDELLPTIQGNIAEAVVSPRDNENFPSILLYMQVKSKTLTEAKLLELKYLLKLRDAQINFTEKTYKNTKITYSSYITGVNFPMGFGYIFIKNNILLLSTSELGMREVVDIINGDERSFTYQDQYTNAMPGINGVSNEVVFMNLREMSPILEQISRLYLFQGMFTRDRPGERIASMLADNAFILGAWDFLGMVWNSKDDVTNLTIFLTKK